MRIHSSFLLSACAALLLACPQTTPDPEPGPLPVDEDGDGADADVDCDDADPNNFPGNEEVCDGADNDCDEALGPDEIDDDVDGVTECDGDCDDASDAVYPGNVEICDTLDNDCDPATDETVDGDTDGFTICDGDCDDASVARTPGLEEACDGVDNDCDEATGFVAVDTYESAGGFAEVRAADATDGMLRGNVFMVAEDVLLHGFEVRLTGGITHTAVVYSRADFEDPFELVAEAPFTDVGPAIDWRAATGLDVVLEAEKQWLIGVVSHGGVMEYGIRLEGDHPGWGHYAGERGLNAAGQTPPVAFAPDWASASVLDLRTSTAGADEADADDDGFVACDDDCDDTSADALPGGTEVSCDLLDNDCDPTTVDCEGGLVITEVFNNAFGDDEDREWFEVLNATEADLDLRGFVVRDEGDESFLVHQTTIVPAGERAVFSQSADFAANGGIIPDFEYYFLDLSNGEDELLLVSPLGEVVDAVRWDTAADFPGQEGASLSLDPTLTDAASNDAASSWCVAVSGPYGLGDEAGTPGEDNGSCDVAASPALVGDLIVTEVMQNPEYVTDAHGEWFEVLNRGPMALDLRGFTFTDDGDDAFTVTGPLLVQPGERLVFADNRDTDVNGGVDIDYRYGGNMTLGNGHDAIVIEAPGGLSLIDRLAWDDGATYPDPAGASMSLDPDFETLDGNDDGLNWCEATNDRGALDPATPGEPNDQCVF